MSMNINCLGNTYNNINTNSKQYKVLKEKGWLSFYWQGNNNLRNSITIYIGVIVSIINPTQLGQNKRPNRLSLSGLMPVTLFSFDGQEPIAIDLHILFPHLQHQE